jgi:hypothetical protein
MKRMHWQKRREIATKIGLFLSEKQIRSKKWNRFARIVFIEEVTKLCIKRI